MFNCAVYLAIIFSVAAKDVLYLTDSEIVPTKDES